MRKCRRHIGDIIELAKGRILAPEIHRARGIHDHKGAKIGLIFVLFDIIFVGFCVDLPVNMADLMAGGVFGIFGKFDRPTVMRGAVQTRQNPLDQRLRLELHGPQFVEHGGVQKFWAQRLAHRSSRSRPIISSVVSPWASAWKFTSRRWRKIGAARARISSLLTVNRPSIMARALPPSTRYCPARGPAPQLIYSRI